MTTLLVEPPKRPVRADPSAEGAPIGVNEWRARRGLTILKVLIVITIFGERIGLPNGQDPISIVMIANLIALGFLAITGVLTVDRQRALWYIAAGSAAVLAAMGVLLTTNSSISLNSLLLLLVIWFTWIFRLRNPYGAALYNKLLDFFLKAVSVLAGLAIFQFFTQFVGLHYTDWMAKWLPANYLIPNYNTSYPVSFGSSIYKANAWVILEPSFLSQFMALGIIIALLRGARIRTILLLLVGLICSLSGTGFLLLIVGLLAIAIRQPWHLRREIVSGGVIALVVLLLSPASSLLLDRLNEFGTTGTSGSSRFVEPYQDVFRYLQSSISRQFLGGGPAATRTAHLSDNPSIIYPIVSKLFGEYGIIAGLIFTAFIVISIYSRARRPVLPTVILVFLFLLSASLTQAHTVTLAWVLLGAFAVAPASKHTIHIRSTGSSPKLSPTAPAVS